MSKLLRYYDKGSVYFVTSVTHNRLPILTDFASLLQNQMNRTARRFACEMIAWVILPDHFHVLINTPSQKLSEFMHDVKLSFSASYRKRKLLSRGSIWQSRFWDHIIRNEVNFGRHLDYIHINPVKHRCVTQPVDYEFSSFGKYLRDGFYQPDWGLAQVSDFEGEFGE